MAYELKPRLVRGLDYYTRTAFEVAAVGLGPRTRWRAAGAIRVGEGVGRTGSARHRLRHRRGPPPEVLPQDFGQDLRPRVFVAALGEPARERPSP